MRAPARGTSRRQGYGRGMNFDGTTPTPARHTLDGGVLVGSDGARRRLVVFEDAQCPYSRQFEEVSGDLLRRELFAAQPPEHTGGFTTEDLLDFGRRAGMASPDYAAGVREGRYEAWAQEIEEAFQEQDPQGTPAALIDGQPVDPGVLYDGQALGALLRS